MRRFLIIAFIILSTSSFAFSKIQISAEQASISACNLSFTPPSLDIPAGGVIGTITFSLPASCNWTAESNVSWIIINSGGAGSGNGSVNFTVQENNSVARTGNITISGGTLTVNQAGAVGATVAATRFDFDG